MTSSPTGVSAVDVVLLLVLVADNGIGVAGIIVVSRVGCVAFSEFLVSQSCHSVHINCQQVFMRQGVKVL